MIYVRRPINFQVNILAKKAIEIIPEIILIFIWVRHNKFCFLKIHCIYNNKIERLK